jgi:hypothetical protein
MRMAVPGRTSAGPGGPDENLTHEPQSSCLESEKTGVPGWVSIFLWLNSSHQKSAQAGSTINLHGSYNISSSLRMDGLKLFFAGIA